MAQFPDAEHAVSAVQEILQTPFGSHIRKISPIRVCNKAHEAVECIELLDDHSEARSSI